MRRSLKSKWQTIQRHIDKIKFLWTSEMRGNINAPLYSLNHPVLSHTKLATVYHNTVPAKVPPVLAAPSFIQCKLQCIPIKEWHKWSVTFWREMSCTNIVLLIFCQVLTLNHVDYAIITFTHVNGYHRVIKERKKLNFRIY